MSHIDDLISKLCPEGVEFEPMGNLVRIRNGRDYKSLASGDVPVYGTGGVMTYVATAAHPGPSVLIPRKGSLDKLYFVDRPFWTVDTIFYTEIGPRLLPKFFYHVLVTKRLEEMNQAGGVPSLTQTVLNMVRIPVPPLQIQLEIVRILDHFAELEEELEAELAARRRQYAHYRRNIMIQNPETPWSRLGDVTVNHDRHRRPVTRSDRNSGPYPYYGANGIQDYVNEYIFDGIYLLVGEDGSVQQPDGTPILNWATGKIWVNNHAHVLTARESNISLRYLYHYLWTADISGLVSGGTQPKLNQSNLNRIPVPMPSRHEQDTAVAALDRLDALANSPSIGLPAELAARRQQYHHYRNRLLTFEEAK